MILANSVKENGWMDMEMNGLESKAVKGYKYVFNENIHCQSEVRCFTFIG
jgi:hypothetical protein